MTSTVRRDRTLACLLFVPMDIMYSVGDQRVAQEFPIGHLGRLLPSEGALSFSTDLVPFRFVEKHLTRESIHLIVGSGSVGCRSVRRLARGHLK